MPSFRKLSSAMFTAAALIGAGSAHAEALVYEARLDGTSGVHATGSAATGAARIQVDTARGRVGVELRVEGIGIDALWDPLVVSPIGPIHFHKYADAAGGGASVLVLPLPYGASYRPTPGGLEVSVKAYDYAAGAKLTNSTLSFDEFVAVLGSGLVVLNVHTDAFNQGEIAGRITSKDRSRSY